MSAFVDETRFEVRSGDGGAGSSSFRREKYAPRGGPDGGDGGKGGDVIFVTRRNLSTLSHTRGKSIFKAQHGESGRGKKMHGRNGDDVIIPVPPGTIIRDARTSEILHDFPSVVEGDEWIFLKGGIGGLGNWHFRTSRNRTPTYSQDGKPGSTRDISLELALIADIGLVGLPSAGKSSIINALTAANSKVGAYPFTTKIPNLGVLRRGESDVVIADIPGLIEGASGGAGLGHKFLRHISRSGSLAFITDLNEEDPVRAVNILEDELRRFDRHLPEKRRIIVGSKTDLDDSGEKLRILTSSFPGEKVLGVSVFSRDGLKNLIDVLIEWGSPVS